MGRESAYDRELAKLREEADEVLRLARPLKQVAEDRRQEGAR